MVNFGSFFSLCTAVLLVQNSPYVNHQFSAFFWVCPYLFICSFDLSVWYQVLFDMICLHGTSFCIPCLLFLYILVLNVSQLFFVYPFLFQFHPCFLCFSISIILFFLHSSKGFPVLVYPFLFLFFLCFPLKKSIVKLHHFVYKHVTIGANQVGYQYKNKNQVVNHIEVLKTFILLSPFYLSYRNF